MSMTNARLTSLLCALYFNGVSCPAKGVVSVMAARVQIPASPPDSPQINDPRVFCCLNLCRSPWTSEAVFW